MILNVIKDGEYTSYNNITKNANKEELEENTNEKVQLKRIKQLLNESELRYVSANVKQLLGITKKDDPNCFKKPQHIVRKVVKPGEKFRVILYIRLSVEDGDLENGDVSGSIKNQLLYLLDECEKRDWLVVGIFCEEDISGVDDNRPEWLKSIRFAEVGNTEIVLCKSQSRFTRSMEMVEKYLHKCFPEWNVRFLGLVDNSDTAVAENKKSRQINGLVNEWYVEDTSKNTRATLNSMMKNGEFVGSFAPYGYIIDPKDKHHLIPDLEVRPVIQLMAGMLSHGKSMKTVINVLMAKRILTPADYKDAKGIKVRRREHIKCIRYEVEEGETLKSIAKKFYVTVEEIKEESNLKTNKISKGDILIIPHRQKWTSQMIKNIVTDETQIGSLVQGRTERTSFKNKKPIPKPRSEWIIVPHCHEANLDLETFNTVNALFQQNTKTRGQKNGELPLFSKKLYCSCCGKPFYKNNSNVKNGKREYLICRGNTPANGHICDNRDSIALEELKSYVLNCIQDKINNYYNLSKLNKEYYLQNIYSNIENDIKNLEKQKSKIESDIQNKKNILVQLYADKVNGTLDISEFNIIKESNSLQISQLEDRLIDINEEINNLMIDKEKQLDKEKLFEQYKDIKELNKVVLDAFISKIEIGKLNKETSERPIKIKWNLYAS